MSYLPLFAVYRVRRLFLSAQAGLFVLLLAVLGILSCSDPGEPDPLVEATACPVILRFQLSTSARTVVPSGPTDVVSYSVSAVGPDEASFEAVTDRAWISTELAPGAWSFSVDGLDSSGHPLVRGSVSTLLESGSAADISLSLIPLPGDGILALSFVLPESFDGQVLLSLSLCDGSEADPLLTACVSSPFEDFQADGLASGYYLLSLSLADSLGTLIPDSQGLSDVVRILADRTTSLLADFASAPAAAGLQFLVPDTSPLSITLPSLLEWSVSCALPLEARCPAYPSTGAWYLDSVKVSEWTSSYSAGLSLPCAPLGFHRLALVVFSDLRAGSTGIPLRARSGSASGSSLWRGVFGPSPGSSRDGDALGYISLATATDQSGTALLFALDGAYSEVSALHLFRLSQGGLLFPLAEYPVLSKGSASGADGISVTRDGRYCFVWNEGSSWVLMYPVLRGSDDDELPYQLGSPLRLDSASLGLDSALTVKAVRPAPDADRGWILSSSPNRLIALDLSASAFSGSSFLDYWVPLDSVSVGSYSVTNLAAGHGGSLLVLSEAGDSAALYREEDGVAPLCVFSTKDAEAGSLPWLKAPTAAAALPSGAFVFLCEESSTLGVISEDGGAASIASASDIPSLAGAMGIAAHAGRNMVSVVGSGGFSVLSLEDDGDLIASASYTPSSELDESGSLVSTLVTSPPGISDAFFFAGQKDGLRIHSFMAP